MNDYILLCLFIMQTEIERNDLNIKCDTLQKHIHSLEGQVNAQNIQLSDVQNEAAQNKATSVQMRYVHVSFV